MKIAADASAVVAEALRQRGRHIFEHPAVDLSVAAPTWSEVEHEIQRRIAQMAQHRRIEPELIDDVLNGTMARLRRHITIVSIDEYRQHEAVARARVPRDPNDWPTIAVALALDAGIWTHDYDFFGCGIPVWTTETLLTHLDT